MPDPTQALPPSNEVRQVPSGCVGLLQRCKDRRGEDNIRIAATFAGDCDWHQANPAYVAACLCQRANADVSQGAAGIRPQRAVAGAGRQSWWWLLRPLAGN